MSTSTVPDKCPFCGDEIAHGPELQQHLSDPEICPDAPREVNGQYDRPMFEDVGVGYSGP